ncbi:Uncharacterised protein [Escherichia coli]|nr:Uncharacterised protein [Escherichia coli]
MMINYYRQNEMCTKNCYKNCVTFIIVILDWPPESPDNQYHLNK